MSDETSPTTTDEQRVIGERPCIRCGYDLRTLSAGGKCPECGLDVALSLRRAELSHADPIWLTTIAVGAVIGAASSACSAVVWIMPFDSPMFADTWFYAYFYSSLYAAPVADWASAWLITSPERESPAPEPRTSLRRLNRVAITLCTLGTLVLLNAWQTTTYAWSVIGTAWSFVCIAETVIFYTYVRRLGMRGGDLFVVTHAPIVMGVGIASGAVVELLPWLQALLRHVGVGIGEHSAGPVGRMLAVLATVYSGIFLWNARRMLQHCALQSRTNWYERERTRSD